MIDLLALIPFAFYCGVRWAQFRSPGEMSDAEYKRLRKASQWRSQADKRGSARKVFHEVYGE